jgi:large repetitive protein
VRCTIPFAISLLALLSGCASQSSPTPAPTPAITSVVPSASGIPTSVATLGNLEFVSVQGTGQIFTYNISTGSQVQVGQPYATPCTSPSGMVLTTSAGNTIMAVVCFDTGSLLTLTVQPNGTLGALGSVSGLPMPYPCIVLDGTNVLVPLFGQTNSTNGGVARVSIATPATPVITGTATLASPVPGEFANPGSLTASNGFIYVAAGSESDPQLTSSSIQVVNEATMTLVGTPLTVAHSPQQIAVQGSTAYITFFDATQLESIDISNPASLKSLQIASLATTNPSCHALPITIVANNAYVGCYDEGVIDQFNITNPAGMQLTGTISGVDAPQRLQFAGQYLLVPASDPGGRVYQINMETP